MSTAPATANGMFSGSAGALGAGEVERLARNCFRTSCADT